MLTVKKVPEGTQTQAVRGIWYECDCLKRNQEMKIELIPIAIGVTWPLWFDDM
jgi:hypothetical protein